MKWYCIDQLRFNSRGESVIFGGFATEEEAAAPDNNIFQEVDGYLDTLPVPVSLVPVRDGELEIWSDGYQRLIKE